MRDAPPWFTAGLSDHKLHLSDTSLHHLDSKTKPLILGMDDLQAWNKNDEIGRDPRRCFNPYSFILARSIWYNQGMDTKNRLTVGRGCQSSQYTIDCATLGSAAVTVRCNGGTCAAPKP